MTRPERCSLALAAALLAASGAASAEPPSPAAPPDRAVAEALFKAARALVDAGDHAAGCPKFEASQAMVPSASTLINIARCREHEGKTASAWAEYGRAVTLIHGSPADDRHKALLELAEKARAALEPRIPRLRVVVTKQPPGARVLRDGQELPAGALGEALPADPGQHEISVTAPGYRGETRSVVLEEGKSATVSVSLEFVITAPAPSGPRAEAPKAEAGAPVWAFVSGGAGLVAAGAAVFFLADDLAAIAALHGRCKTTSSGTTCAQGYDYAADNARKNRDLPLAVGLGTAGLAAVGAGIYGLARRPPTERASAAFRVSPTPGGVVVTGVF
jgi:hypothetical protein